MSAQEGVVGEPKFYVDSELSYQNKSSSECQQDVRKHYVSMSICPYVNISICQNATFQLRYQNESCSERRIVRKFLRTAKEPAIVMKSTDKTNVCL